MSEIRTPSANSRYYLPKETFLTTVHYARQYGDWKRELQSIEDTSRAIAYDADKVQTSSDADPTFVAAARANELKSKVSIVEKTAEEAGEDIYAYLLIGVSFGWTFDQLKAHGMPCEKKMYYERRRRFYWILSRKI